MTPMRQSKRGTFFYEDNVYVFYMKTMFTNIISGVLLSKTRRGQCWRPPRTGWLRWPPRCSPDQPAVLARRTGRPQLAQVSEWHFIKSSGAGNMPHMGASDSMALRSHPRHHLHSITPLCQSHVKDPSLIQRQKPRDVDDEDHV